MSVLLLLLLVAGTYPCGAPAVVVQVVAVVTSWVGVVEVAAGLRRIQVHSDGRKPVSYTHLTLPTTPYV